MLAQKYPDAYDGIAAAAPAMNWGQLIPSTTWSQVMMSITGLFPPKCELDALTNAAIETCDPLDGVEDGLISDLAKCAFDPFTWVGRTAHCRATNKTVVISDAAAIVANFTWTGPRNTNGEFLWYGVDYQARLAGTEAAVEGSAQNAGVAITLCSGNGTCTGLPTGLGDEWFRLFVKKDPDWVYTNIKSAEEFADLFHAGLQEFDSIIGTVDPDLSAFKSAGGKLLTYHGLVRFLTESRRTLKFLIFCNRPTKLSPSKALRTIITVSTVQSRILRIFSASSRFPALRTALAAVEVSRRQYFKH